MMDKYIIVIMALATVYHEWRKRNGWCIRFYPDGKGKEQMLYGCDRSLKSDRTQEQHATVAVSAVAGNKSAQYKRERAQAACQRHRLSASTELSRKRTLTSRR